MKDYTVTYINGHQHNFIAELFRIEEDSVVFYKDSKAFVIVNFSNVLSIQIDEVKF